MYPYLFLYESNILKYYPSKKKCCSKKMYNDHCMALILLAHCWVPLGGWRTQFENQGSKMLLSEHHCIKHLKGNNQALLSPVCTQTCIFWQNSTPTPFQLFPLHQPAGSLALPPICSCLSFSRPLLLLFLPAELFFSLAQASKLSSELHLPSPEQTPRL